MTGLAGSGQKTQTVRQFNVCEGLTLTGAKVDWVRRLRAGSHWIDTAVPDQISCAPGVMPNIYA